MKKICSVLSCLVLFTQFINAAPPEVVLKKGDTVIFFGDSITYGHRNRRVHDDPTGYVTQVGNSIKAVHPDWNVNVINAGVCGNDVKDLQSRLQKDVLSKNPNIVYIYIGVNDVWKWEMKRANFIGTTKEDYEAGLKDLIGKIKAAGAQVILATPAIHGEKIDGTNHQDKMLDEYCDISRRVASEQKVPLIDLRKAFMNYLKAHNPGNKEKGVLTKDGVHPILEGDKLLAGEMLKVLGIPLAECTAEPNPGM